MKRNGFTLIEFMMVVTIIGILFSLAFSQFGFVTIFPNYSSGTRTGVVYKISHKGLFWKTWECEMNIGGMSSNGGGMAVPVVWRFSVKDKAVVDALMRCAKQEKEKLCDRKYK